MSVSLDTCEEIQPAYEPHRTPLFLIHDGGGTIFSYHLLGDFDRQVFGISNPCFEHGNFDGGVHELALLYAGFIKSKVTESEVLIGGWSFGGMLALEISHILSTDDNVRVKGQIYIDSPYPGNTQPVGLEVAPAGTNFAPTTKSEVRDNVNRCMDDARRMVSDWTLPTWQTGPPPTVLLRARDPVYQRGSGKVARVDFARDDPLLGWSNYGYNFIRETHEVSGDHYKVFKFEYLDDITEKIKEACEYLDR
ncbi:hypothetical protein CAC42_3570 [Sphaceloma murrayae]|uniref:Thioesterase domain-containing protein n=1 Tax=Sphaceloma murrayae TaxID=2082308 RepID=A0A2K1QSV4_9PEZI|nr:hypothetical protein CAC42_3570 [Sphaceloma murrayae]